MAGHTGAQNRAGGSMKTSFSGTRTIRAGLVPLVLPVLLMAAPGAARAQAQAPTHFTCDDGTILVVTYPDSKTAWLTIDNHRMKLWAARSADGARYIGHGWQWWSKGTQNGQLAKLPPGKTMAPDPGQACHAMGG
jgi:membrane-bound inhibitor of C-type lysozyme